MSDPHMHNFAGYVVYSHMCIYKYMYKPFNEKKKYFLGVKKQDVKYFKQNCQITLFAILAECRMLPEIY